MDKNNPPLGRSGLPPMMRSGAPQPDPDEIVGRLRTTFASPDYKPPLLPAVALELLQLSRRQDVHFKSIRSLLEKEPLIAARILRTAQSALYTRVEPVRSLDQALTRLGLKTLVDLFLETALTMKVFRAKGYEEPMNRLRRHSTAVAHVSRIICRHTSVDDEYAFLCGLLHDVGIAASIIALSDAPRGAKLPDFAGIWAPIASIHEDAGATLMRLWELPPELQIIIGNHHHPTVDGRPHPLAAAVCLASSIANEFGAGLYDEVLPDTIAEAEKILNITEPLKKAILTEAHTAVSRIEQ